MIGTSTDIARPEWARALDDFTAMHEGWLVTVEVTAPDVGTRRAIANLPLAGVFYEVGETAMLTIAAGTERDHVVHMIPQPERLSIERADGRSDAALHIESADGTTTLVRLKNAVDPETVDGMPRPYRDGGTR